MSRSLSTNCGSVESLNCFNRCAVAGRVHARCIGRNLRGVREIAKLLAKARAPRGRGKNISVRNSQTP
jgi:hypothetical protein